MMVLLLRANLEIVATATNEALQLGGIRASLSSKEVDAFEYNTGAATALFRRSFIIYRQFSMWCPMPMIGDLTLMQSAACVGLSSGEYVHRRPRSSCLDPLFFLLAECSSVINMLNVRKWLEEWKESS